MNICSHKEVLWDMNLADKIKNVKLNMHKPIRKNAVLECSEPWEGEHCGYGSIVHDGEKYRLYYRGTDGEDSKVNIEALFNTTHKHKELIQNIFTK